MDALVAVNANNNAKWTCILCLNKGFFMLYLAFMFFFLFWLPKYRLGPLKRLYEWFEICLSRPCVNSTSLFSFYSWRMESKDPQLLIEIREAKRNPKEQGCNITLDIFFDKIFIDWLIDHSLISGRCVTDSQCIEW